MRPDFPKELFGVGSPVLIEESSASDPSLLDLVGGLTLREDSTSSRLIEAEPDALRSRVTTYVLTGQLGRGKVLDGCEVAEFDPFLSFGVAGRE